MTGAAAVLMAYAPAASVADIRNALLDGTDPAAALAGKTVTGGRLNLNRALQLLGAPTGHATATVDRSRFNTSPAAASQTT